MGKIRVGIRNTELIVYGDTYRVKEELKEKGFKWDPKDKVWYRDLKPLSRDERHSIILGVMDLDPQNTIVLTEVMDLLPNKKIIQWYEKHNMDVPFWVQMM